MWTLEEFQELVRIKENVRRNANALELCWYCQRISECQEAGWHYGAPVWLCGECLSKNPKILLLLQHQERQMFFGVI